MKIWVAVLALGLIRVSAWGQGAPAAVAQLDLKKISGAWYEMARLPYKEEKPCVADPVTLFTVGDKKGRFALVRSCLNKYSTTESENKDGRRADQSGDGRLKLRTIWPFYSKFWVLAVDPEYGWVLVGTPNHKQLWVLARTKTIAPELLTEIEGKASAQGFAVGKMVSTPQGTGR